ncbi:survival motor neuron (SMN) interacting protein 1 (SIP1) domain-containing protein [Phthorimaea operculella]|nr:survival motor neuron (SMN) interacting protein 1 (SIP1) domain-containing protein [Phthorimaea operculella]
MWSRKPNDLENSDDLLKPCFQIDPSVELKEVPETGEEYLLKVINERKKYKEITECDLDVSKFAKYQNCFVEEDPVIPVDEKLKPTIEWQNMQIADFSEMRMRISCIKQKKLKKIKNIKNVPTCAREWKLFFKGVEPTLTTVLGLQSASVDEGLETVTDILKKVPPGESIDHRTGQWTYSLLTCVQYPLLTETRVILRALAKKCREVRSHINPDAENAIELVAPLNIFICLLSRYFENEDLADHR